MLQLRAAPNMSPFNQLPCGLVVQTWAPRPKCKCSDAVHPGGYGPGVQMGQPIGSTQAASWPNPRFQHPTLGVAEAVLQSVPLHVLPPGKLHDVVVHALKVIGQPIYVQLRRISITLLHPAMGMLRYW